MTPRLEATGLTCSYGDRVALRDFGLTVSRGAVVGLLGANGAGKTTALRAMARLHRPDRGRVCVRGRDLWQESPRWCARHVAYVPQTDRVFGPVTVQEVAALGRAPHRGWLLPWSAQDRRVVERILERLDLIPLRDRPLDTLSGGERRRALLARALAQEVEVLLLDEPTAHLDLRHQVRLLGLLEELVTTQELAVVASFHDLNQAAQHAHRLVLLREGEVLAQGPVEDVLRPETLWQAYEVEVDVSPHPATGIPTVLPVRPTPDGDPHRVVSDSSSSSSPRNTNR